MNAAAIALNTTNLSRLDPARIATPDYAREDIRTGVLHLGPGAFHRAHQADYFDQLLARDPRWGIAGVSLHSGAVAEALAAQDGLYTQAILDEDIRYRVIGAVQAVIRSSDVRFRLLQSAPSIRLITLTITEKGYCLRGDGRLDVDHPDIAADLRSPRAPRSAIGWLVEALRVRFDAGTSIPDILSCDNLSGNGDKLRQAVVDFAAAINRDLSLHIEDQVRFPNSMVDSITPATDDALRERVAREAGVDDRWPIQREAFTSWVIEDAVSADFPDLESVGAVMTPNVAAHERAKLRLLNGAHSTLAYLGLGRGHASVAEAMNDPALGAVISEMMKQEIAPSIAAPSGLDLDDYRRSLLARFRNPSIVHKLSQIAWDGSQKLPIRILGTIADNLKAGRSIARLSLGVAAWMRFVRRSAVEGAEITDPMAAELKAIGRACRDEARHDCALFFERTGIFPEALLRDHRFVNAVQSAYEQLTGDRADAGFEKAVGL